MEVRDLRSYLGCVLGIVGDAIVVGWLSLADRKRRKKKTRAKSKEREVTRVGERERGREFLYRRLTLVGTASHTCTRTSNQPRSVDARHA